MILPGGYILRPEHEEIRDRWIEKTFESYLGTFLDQADIADKFLGKFKFAPQFFTCSCDNVNGSKFKQWSWKFVTKTSVPHPYARIDEVILFSGSAKNGPVELKTGEAACLRIQCLECGSKMIVTRYCIGMTGSCYHKVDCLATNILELGTEKFERFLNAFNLPARWIWRGEGDS